MIKEDKLLELLNDGFDFNILYVLQNIKNLPINKKVYGWKLNCLKLEYIDAFDNITEKGADIVNLFLTPSIENVKSNLKLDEWCISTEKELTDHLMKVAQKKASFKGFGNVTFLPTEVELKKHLIAFWKEYKSYNDLDKIKKVLISHIDDCNSKNNWAPAIKYFIFKKGTGTHLASAYKFFEEKEETVENNIINKPKIVKNLF